MRTLLTLNICLMCHVQTLWLSENKISDAGLTALAKAVESGALASNATIYMRGNNVTETGEQVMRNAAEARGLDVIF